jgi:Tfp pilus assembly protein PilO
LVLVIGWLIIWPKFGEYSDLKQNIEIKQIELQYKEEYIAKLQSLKEKLEEKKDQVSKISSALPDENSTPSIYKFIEESASASGMALEGISPFSEAVSQINSRLNETSFSVNVSGSYPAFKSFLTALEKSARLFDMDSISLSMTSEEDIFKFQLGIKAFNY